jgi:trehalose 6-phosphate phosphatase
MQELPPPPIALLDGTALFLDFDGTLVELADTPGAIRVPHSLSTMLRRLRDQLGGRLAIVSGRGLADLERHLAAPGIAVAGSHGLELKLADGGIRPWREPEGIEAVRRAVADFAANGEGLVAESKPLGVALHYRLAPQREAAALAFMADLAQAHGFVVQRGKMVAELRPAGADKGDALRALMDEEGFRGARPVFVGDDLTDEPAFAAAAALGGAGILVGPARRTAARYRLASVAAVADWLQAAR